MIDKIKALNREAWESQLSNVSRAMELCSQIRSLLEEYPDKEELIRCQSVEVECLFRRGMCRKAILLGESTLEMIDEISMDELRPQILGTLGSVYWQMGSYRKALEYYREQNRTAQELGDKINMADGLNNMGLVYTDTGEYEKSYDFLHQALALYEELEHLSRRALALNNLAMNRFSSGHSEEALELVGKAKDLLAGAERFQALELAVLDTAGMIHGDLGDFEQALLCFEEALAMAEVMGSRSEKARTLFRMGSMHFEMGDSEGAFAVLNRVLGLLEKSELNRELFQCHQILSKIREENGEWELSLEHFKKFHEIKEKVFNETASHRIENLQTAHEMEIKELSGLLPICAHCKKIRNDTGYWEDVSVYISHHSEAEFSHGLCPECAKELYPDIEL